MFNTEKFDKIEFLNENNHKNYVSISSYDNGVVCVTPSLKCITMDIYRDNSSLAICVESLVDKEYKPFTLGIYCSSVERLMALRQGLEKCISSDKGETIIKSLEHVKKNNVLEVRKTFRID